MNYARRIRKVLSIYKLRIRAFHSETIQTKAQSLQAFFNVFFHSFSDAMSVSPTTSRAFSSYRQ